jgi:hypothetical protein
MVIENIDCPFLSQFINEQFYKAVVMGNIYKVNEHSDIRENAAYYIPLIYNEKETSKYEFFFDVLKMMNIRDFSSSGITEFNEFLHHDEIQCDRFFNHLKNVEHALRIFHYGNGGGRANREDFRDISGFLTRIRCKIESTGIICSLAIHGFDENIFHDVYRPYCFGIYAFVPEYNESIIPDSNFLGFSEKKVNSRLIKKINRIDKMKIESKELQNKINNGKSKLIQLEAEIKQLNVKLNKKKREVDREIARIDVEFAKTVNTISTMQCISTNSSINDIIKNYLSKFKIKYQKQALFNIERSYFLNVNINPEDAIEQFLIEPIFDLLQISVYRRVRLKRDMELEENKKLTSEMSESLITDYCAYIQNQNCWYPIEVKTVGKINNGIKQAYSYLILTIESKILHFPFSVLTDGIRWKFIDINNNVEIFDVRTNWESLKNKLLLIS